MGILFLALPNYDSTDGKAKSFINNDLGFISNALKAKIITP
jgi:hypothetical protein